MTRESDIVHEYGSYWVLRGRKHFTVFKNGVTHSTSDSAYPRTKDGLSLAIARCDYLGRREAYAGQSELCRAYAAHLTREQERRRA